MEKIICGQLFFIFFLATTLASDFGKEVFGGNFHYFPAAFGNFNADKLTDVFVIEKYPNDTYAVRVLIAAQDAPLLRPEGPVCNFEYLKVQSVIPGDYDGDGDSDVLILTQNGQMYNAYILWGDFNLNTMECISDEVAEIPIAVLKSQPLIFDYDGDMIPDLLGEDVNGTRCVWVLGSTHEYSQKIRFPYLFENVTLGTLRISGGHAFVDVDSDMSADIWLTTDTYFELWLSSENFKNHTVINFPTLEGKSAVVVGQSVFTDIDLDGQIELILPVCFDSSCLKSALYVYEFGDEHWYDLKTDFYDSSRGVLWTFQPDSSYFYTNTITPRVGDFNLDGYPDVLITMFDSDSRPQVILLANEGCYTSSCYSQSLIPVWDIFHHWKLSVMGAFFDFEEDGHLEVLLVNVSESSPKTYDVGVYKDSKEYDAMFLKVQTLTGRCYQNCSPGVNSISYGTNQPGISVVYSMESSTGETQTACATQLSQSSHFALQYPYDHFGLGRNWNFVSTLMVGIPTNISYASKLGLGETSSNYSFSQTFTQIIPNSQLVVTPFPINEPGLWKTTLFITPSKTLMMTGGALIGTCIFIAAIIGLLHWKEKRQDKQEKLQQAQRFHFDAM